MLLVLFTVLFIVFLALSIWVKDEFGDAPVWALVFTLIFGIAFLICIISIPISRGVECPQEVAKNHSLQQTLAYARQSGDALEKAAIVQKIAEYNENLASDQWSANNIWFAIWYTDEFRALKPIR